MKTSVGFVGTGYSNFSDSHAFLINTLNSWLVSLFLTGPLFKMIKAIIRLCCHERKHSSRRYKLLERMKEIDLTFDEFLEKMEKQDGLPDELSDLLDIFSTSQLIAAPMTILFALLPQRIVFLIFSSNQQTKTTKI